MGIIRINPEELAGASVQMCVCVCVCVCTLANDFPLGIFSTPNQGEMMSFNLAGPDIYKNSSDAVCTVRYTIPTLQLLIAGVDLSRKD